MTAIVVGIAYFYNRVSLFSHFDMCWIHSRVICRIILGGTESTTETICTYENGVKIYDGSPQLE